MKCLAPAQKNQIELLNEDLKRWYYGAGRSCYRLRGKISLDRLKTQSGWPKLQNKVASTRHLSGYCLDLCKRYNSGTEHDARRLAIVQLLHRFYEVLEQGDFFLSESALRELAEIGPNLVILYNALSTEAAALGVRSWKFSPKFHLWVHLCEDQARILNPKHFWCYGDEDLVGKVIKISQSVHTNNVADAAIYKWLLLHCEQGAVG